MQQMKRQTPRSNEARQVGDIAKELLKRLQNQVTDELIQGIEKVGIIHKNRLN